MVTHLPLHVTASALVVHPPSRRVLLRWHLRMDGWFQVGGHGDPGESDPWASRSARPRRRPGSPISSPPPPRLDRRPVQVVVVPVPAAKGEPDHEHADLRYLLATATPDAARAESADAPVRWFTLAEARSVVEANLVDLLDRVERAIEHPDARG